jgi:hypothetical protein
MGIIVAISCTINTLQITYSQGVSLHHQSKKRNKPNEKLWDRPPVPHYCDLSAFLVSLAAFRCEGTQEVL